MKFPKLCWFLLFLMQFCKSGIYRIDIEYRDTCKISNIAIPKNISLYRVRYFLLAHGPWDGHGSWPSSDTSERLFSCSGNAVCHCNVAVSIGTSLEAENVSTVVYLLVGIME